MLRKSVETRDWLNTIEPRNVRPVMKRVVEDISAIEQQVGQLFEEGFRKDRSSDSTKRSQPYSGRQQKSNWNYISGYVELNLCWICHNFILRYLGGSATEPYGAVWQQVITWANVDPDLCHHMASLDHNEFTLHVLNINIHLHFMSLLHIDMTKVLKILPHVRPGPTYST